MKNLVYLLLIFLLISCGKNESEEIIPEPESYGFIEGFIKADPNVILEKTTESDWTFNPNAETHRGYMFIPKKDIRITEIGGKIAQTGIYDLELFLLDDNANFLKSDTLLSFAISITDINNFQYKKVSENIVLLSGKRYLIRYYNKTHDSVYDIIIPETYPYDAYSHPLKTEDLEVEQMYYTYLIYNPDGILIDGTEGGIKGRNIMRGLPDFRYELIE